MYTFTYINHNKTYNTGSIIINNSQNLSKNENFSFFSYQFFLRSQLIDMLLTTFIIVYVKHFFSRKVQESHSNRF